MTAASAWPLTPGGEWVEVKPGADGGGRAALFLDRDGVIVEEVIYLHRPEEVALIPGAADTVAAANAAGVPVVIVTNQPGVGRGYYGWADFATTQACIEAELWAHGRARVDAVIACPYTPGGDGPYVHPDHPCRKPNPGMLLAARDRLGVALAGSWIVGDRGLDISAGRRAGLAGGVHVATGFGQGDDERRAALAEAGTGYTVRTVSSIADALGAVPLLAGASGGRFG
ncbi:D-glycero-D-manno-heptose 1,7-bisphosphate phosphatase [Limimonas halophila]|uniref:D,D-heptose 1,7-bisphosphate phosphatase n=1 Tax=Limimonas halophila TaxID=1082479 RepID=A0A1G7S8X6_9PROT|nr:HAD-IIIA family hydrolase [Limimonas halophila]SDG19458.1 D-glycero-D-manno-heptose 1,7-bisphosphate phosphatase [Limimonas halophila]